MKRKWQMKAKKKQIIGKNDNGHRRKGNSKILITNTTFA